jgi:cold shock CspA family protein
VEVDARLQSYSSGSPAKDLISAWRGSLARAGDLVVSRAVVYELDGVLPGGRGERVGLIGPSGAMIRGTVKSWDDEEGWGVLVSPDAPGETWAHYSHIEAEPKSYRSLAAGDTVMRILSGQG